MANNASSSNDQAVGLSRVTGGTYGSTGAPGTSGSEHQLNPHDPSPTHNATTDLVTPTHHSLAENITNIVDQSSWPHDGVEKSSANAKPIVGTTTTDTGAGHGTPSHKNGRS